MVFFNWATMQMAAKIVYYGPGLCGKTTNLSYIYAKTAPGSRGEMVSLETETDRTLFFDLLPIEVGKVGGFRTRLQLYTVPGQVFYNTTRKLVLKGVDGVVFVADSQRPMLDADIESLKNLDENLGELGLNLSSVPVVLQFNKRDLKNILSVDELQQALNPDGKYETFESCAVDGTGVFETLKAITKATLKSLRKRMATQDATSPAPPAPALAPRPVTGTLPPPTVMAPVTFNPAGLRSAAAEGLAGAGPKQVPPPPDLRPVTPPPPPDLRPARKSEPRAEGTQEPQVEAEVIEVLATPAPVLEPEPAGEALPQPEEILEAPIEEPPPVAEELAGPVTPPSEPQVEAAPPEPPPPAVEAVAAPEEVEEAPVEFATTAEPAPAAVTPEMRHVKVSSSLDILAELETLRKSSTLRQEMKPSAATTPPRPSFDLDSLLQGSLNSRQEVKRRVEERVGRALGRASRCMINIQLVDADGKPLRDVPPVQVDLNRSEKIRQLALTLIVNLHGE